MTEKKKSDVARSSIKLAGIDGVSFGLGASVGRPGPFPYRLELPTDIGPRVATFWVYPWNHRVTSVLSEMGISTNPMLREEHQIKEQNVASAPLIIDKEKGWEDLYRVDGTELPYRPPTEDQEATLNDPRTVLALDAPAIFAKLKGHALKLCIEFRKADEGNSDSSSGSTSKKVAGGAPKRRRSGSKKGSATKAN